MTEHQSQILLLFAGSVAAAVIIQALVLAGAAIVGLRLLKQAREAANEAQVKLFPMLENVQKMLVRAESMGAKVEDLLEDTAPKVKRITQNLAESSDVARAKVAEIDALLTDTTGKARRQSDRVDGMITSTLNKTTEVVNHVQHAIMAPARQLAGIVNGAKASIDSLIHQFAPRSRKTPKPVAFEGESVYTGYEDDYHA